MLARLFQLVGPTFIFIANVTTASAQMAQPRLMQSSEADKPIQLQSLHIASQINGSLAQTTVRMVFFNPNHRQLEGRLQFPLLNGQQITAFALDIDGQMRPAVTVEKAKGRQIFEAVERRNIDPALLEQTAGNNFSLRVYPIASMGTRTVELKYSEALQRSGADWSWRLPLAYGEQVQDLDVSLQVDGSAGAPRVLGARGDVQFKRQATTYHAQIKRSRYKSGGMLTVLIPANKKAHSWVQVQDGTTWFLAEIPLAADASARHNQRALPSVVGLLWDSSGSGANRSHDSELFELNRYFKALGNAEVRLIRLRDRSQAAEIFRVVNGDWSALRAALQTTDYDGASALADWQPASAIDEYLLVSDGLLNYGPTRFPALLAGQRLNALSSAAGADNSRLDALAMRSGGRMVLIDRQKPGAAADALLSDGTRLRNIEALGATEVLADMSGAQQGLIRVAGKLLQDKATLNIGLLRDGKPIQLALAVSAQASVHPLAAHMWAGYQLHALEADFDANRAAIRRLGTTFAIPTRETSLLVLDRLEDYVRYKVAPPAEYLAAYNASIQQRELTLNQQQSAHLERVVREFQQKQAWWQKDYPKGEPPKKVAISRPAAIGVPPPASMPARVAAVPSPALSLMTVAPRPVATNSASAAPDIGITLKKWTSDAPSIGRMAAASPTDIYRVYLDEKPSYANSSAFYLDAADMLLDKGLRELALRVLSNLAEMDLENRHVLRILGYRLLQANAPELAIPVFEKVLTLGEEEPQSFRDLGLAHAAAGHVQQAIDHLNEVILRPWADRFAEVELIALAEMNALIATAPKKPVALDTSRIDPRLLVNMPLDLRAVLTWDADNSDMDLWVTDPNGESSYYGNRFTYQGGRMSRDFTGGYGPEEFSLRRAKPGKYKVQATFFGHRQQVVAGATTLQVRLSTGFGTQAAKEQMITLRLKGAGEKVLVGEFEVGAD